MQIWRNLDLQKSICSTKQEVTGASMSVQHHSTIALVSGVFISTLSWYHPSIIQQSGVIENLLKRSVQSHFVKSTCNHCPGDLFSTCIRNRLIALRNELKIDSNVPSESSLVKITVIVFVSSFNVSQKHLSPGTNHAREHASACIEKLCKGLE